MNDLVPNIPMINPPTEAEIKVAINGFFRGKVTPYSEGSETPNKLEIKAGMPIARTEMLRDLMITAKTAQAVANGVACPKTITGS